MKIIFFSHPLFFNSQSMQQYTNMLAKGMENKGHEVEIWQPKPYIFNWPLPSFLKKWAGYFDQFVLFPREVKNKLKNYPNDTLFVFIDNALGPWVPLVSDRLHVIHCHDFMAQKAAIGQIEENKISFTGKLYQAFIRKGYLRGKNFISVSQKTKNDLELILNNKPQISEVVYNGLNPNFSPIDKNIARKKLSEIFKLNFEQGFMLHVGGNLWYKNRTGVIEIYNTLRGNKTINYPLLLVGEAANESIANQINQSPFKNDIFIKSKLDESTLNLAYNAASFFIFPSLEEGFGWPIAEAMACNTLVVTTNEMPMTEVGGNAAVYIPKRPFNIQLVSEWSKESARIIEQMLSLDNNQLEEKINLGKLNIQRFDLNKNIDRMEEIYLSIK